MSGPIVRKYGFPNHEQIFGKRPLEHGAEAETDAEAEAETDARAEPKPAAEKSAKPAGKPGKKKK